MEREIKEELDGISRREETRQTERSPVKRGVIKTCMDCRHKDKVLRWVVKELDLFIAKTYEGEAMTPESRDRLDAALEKAKRAL